MSSPSHMTRMTRGLLSLVILALLGFTLSSVAFSGASYTAPSANPANVFASGDLLHINSANGVVLLSANGMAPGDSSAGTMTITGAGNLDGAYALAVEDLTQTPAAPRLSDALRLTVQDVTGAPVTLYSGSVTAFADAALGTIAPGSVRTYRVVLAYPAGTTVAALQGATLSFGLRVTGVSQ